MSRKEDFAVYKALHERGVFQRDIALKLGVHTRTLVQAVSAARRLDVVLRLARADSHCSPQGDRSGGSCCHRSLAPIAVSPNRCLLANPWSHHLGQVIDGKMEIFAAQPHRFVLDEGRQGFRFKDPDL